MKLPERLTGNPYWKVKMDFLTDPAVLALQLVEELKSLTQPNTAVMRTISRSYSREINIASPDYVLKFTRLLCFEFGKRWIAYEILADHKAAFKTLGSVEIEEFGQGINSWWTVDSFARTLSGPAWLNGQIEDSLIHKWAHSTDLWWRRAALVSTVALNLRSKGGMGDVHRTLVVCNFLVDDREDMVVKALSWALRELVRHDPAAVKNYLDQNEHILAALVKREVRNKLNTGLKTPNFAGK
ncbi:MAG: DNA alkylation repair protein [Anaerolineales bacterium]